MTPITKKSTEHPDQPMSRADMLKMFTKMGEIFAESGAYFEIAIYGGSAIMLSFDYRESTVDIDFMPVKGSAIEVSDVANQAAEALGLQQNILRDDVAMFVSETVKYNLFGEFPKGTGNLRIFTAAPDYIFAMKMMSMRNVLETQDVRDVWELADVCGITDVETAIDVLAQFYPEKKLPVRNKLILEDVFTAKKNNQKYSNEIGW